MKTLTTGMFVLGLGLGVLLTVVWQQSPEYSSRGLANPPVNPKLQRGPGPVVNPPKNPKLMRGPGPVMNPPKNPKLILGPGPVMNPPLAQNEATSDTAANTVKPEFPGASAAWTRGFDTKWIDEERERHEIKPHADNSSIVKMTDSQREGDTYGNYTEKDLLLWQKETERLVVEGSLIFHNADLLGSTNATSCDMCHPDGEGTHAETYPKYQVQLGRAALLRDMANWCLENPCRAEPMSGDDPRMRALEAYMQAQRTGKPMKYGKH